MKKILAAAVAVIMCAFTLCSCARNTADSIRNDAGALASEVKDNLDGMINNGEVHDGDGVIGETKRYEDDVRDSTVPTDAYPTDNTEPTGNDKGVFDSAEATNASEFV